MPNPGLSGETPGEVTHLAENPGIRGSKTTEIGEITS
jgi:hypothetical protein